MGLIVSVVAIGLGLLVFIFFASIIVPSMRPSWVLQVKRKFGHDPKKKD